MTDTSENVTDEIISCQPKGDLSDHLYKQQNLTNNIPNNLDTSTKEDPRQNLKTCYSNWENSLQARHQIEEPTATVEQTGSAQHNPPTPQTFQDTIENLTNNKTTILSGRLYKEMINSTKVPSKLNHTLECDDYDHYWEAIIDTSNVSVPRHNKTHGDELSKFSIDFLVKNLPPAPKLQPFYTTQEAILLSNKVVASGNSNANGLKIEVKSGMNLPAWRLLLKGYKDEKMIIEGLSYGWPLNWTCSPLLSGQTIKNHPTAEQQYPALIKDWYLDQISKGMLVGPYKREDLPWRNLSTFPLQTVVKDPVEMSRRVCADPTFCPPGLPPGIGSLNQGIPKHSYLGKPYKYNLPRIREFVEDAIEIGLDQVLGFKIDWKFAFRQNPLDPADWWLTVYHIERAGYFLDIRTNFGYRSSGIPQQIESESVSYTLSKISISDPTAKWAMKTFFNDEIVLASPSIAEELYQNSIFLHSLLGIRTSTSTDHMIPPTRVLLALGIVLDFDLAVLYMPANKEEKLRLVLEELKGKEIWSRKDLQKCLGLLNHWTEIIPAGRTFLNRMLPAYKTMSPTQNFFKPDQPFRKDLRWWYKIAPLLNFSPMMVPTTLGPGEFIDMDASGSFGLGAINYPQKEYFLLPTPSSIKTLPIHTGEMAVLMLVVDIWAGPPRSQVEDIRSNSNFSSKQLQLYSDNQSVIASINYGRAKDDFLAMGARFIHHHMAIRDSTLTLSYVNTKENLFADNLSRNCDKTVNFLLSQGFRQVFVSDNRIEQLMSTDM